MMLGVWIALGAAALALITANALTTRRLWSSPAFEPPQKVAQTILLWLLPGSFMLVRHFVTEPHRQLSGDPTIHEGTSSAEEHERNDHAPHHGGGHHGSGGDHGSFNSD